MNTKDSKEQASILLDNGYTHHRVDYGCVWRNEYNSIIARNDLYTIATAEAYAHFLLQQKIQEEIQSQTPIVETASESLVNAEVLEAENEEFLRNQALQADLYELVGLGLVSPDVLLPDKETILAENVALHAENQSLKIEIVDLEKQIEALKSALNQISLNAPQEETYHPMLWPFWYAGQLAKNTLAACDIESETK